MTLSIKIPEQHYVTFMFRDSDIYPLGFLVPDGTDTQAKNRKGTADHWANSSKVKVPARTFINKPLVGFEIRKSVRHSFSKNALEKWRILDPRGFELEITNSNMTLIIESCIIDNGEIIDSCIWAREGSDNVLLPTSCPEYISSVANTVRIGKKISIKDVKLGNTVTYKNGKKGKYLGKYFKFTFNDDRSGKETVECSKNKYYMFEENGNVVPYSTIHISEINKTATITEVEAEQYTNQLISKDKSDYRYRDAILAVSANSIEYSDFTTKETSFATSDELIKSSFYHVILAQANQLSNDYFTFNLYAMRNGYSSGDYEIYPIVKSSYDQDKIIKQIEETSYASSYSRYSNHIRYRKITVNSATFDTDYSCRGLSFIATTKLGNGIEIKI